VMRHDMALVLRMCKAVLMASIGCWSTLVAFDNITDYGSNLQFVQHVLEMDTTFPGNSGMWRAIDWVPLHHFIYALIITAEMAVGVLAGLSAARMLLARHRPDQFRQAKALGAGALTLGIVLWLVGFEVIGGEWFLMWQSRAWNAQEAAFRFVVVLSLTLIFVCQDE